MFEVGWTEMLVIAIVMIVVVGPKDLPAMLRTFGRTVAKLRGMAGDFQKQFNEALKEAELDDVKKSVDSLRSLNPMNEIRKQLNPFEQAAADVRSGIDDVMKPKPAAVDDSTKAATPAVEPAANSTPATPVVGGPEPIPASPTFPAMTDASVVADAKPAAPKKPAKSAATGSAKAAAAKATAVKAAVAQNAAEKPAVKSAPAKAQTAKAVAAPKEAEKPAAKATKPAAAKPEAKPAATAAKKPPAARKKTAGTAK